MTDLRPMVWLDVETTGSSPEQDRVVQLALIIERPSAAPTEWETLINPGRSIPPEATAIHGITDAAVAAAPPFARYAANLAQHLAGADVGGYHVRFDLRVLEEEMKRCDVALDRSAIRIVDGYRLWQLLEPRDLDAAVRRWLGRDRAVSHSALADARDARDVAAAQRAAAGEKLPAELQALHELQFPIDPAWIDAEGKIRWMGGEPCLAFGKYKGMSLRDDSVTRYLRWLLTSDFPDDTKRIVRDALRGVYPAQVKP